MNKYLLLTIAVLASLLWASQCRVSSVKNERDRYEDNQTVLLGSLYTYKNKLGENVATVDRLQLTKKELETEVSELSDKVKDQGVKIKRLQSISETKIKTEIKIVEVFRDSIISIEGRIDTLSCVKINNEHLKIDICIDDNTLSGNIEIPTAITQIIHRIPKKWWFIKWGTKGIRQEIISSNPYTSISYTKYIEIKQCPTVNQPST